MIDTTTTAALGRWRVQVGIDGLTAGQVAQLVEQSDLVLTGFLGDGHLFVAELAAVSAPEAVRLLGGCIRDVVEVDVADIATVLVQRSARP
ncbi:hypothetical protein AB0395_35070 [Streptosporangium sp. NPDC051023]|uniref:hypothetical protein n=1 Tax=Streptosporangium sp. NPDC051023 TaxID=3155410 RepID=UPI00345028F5